LEGTSHALSSMRLSTSISSGGAVSSSRNNYYTTTVSAGNAIHCSCHIKAKTADRNHPKAPKSKSSLANHIQIPILPITHSCFSIDRRVGRGEFAKFKSNM
jgi:hypothetical protein